jgi:hypothetical protein
MAVRVGPDGFSWPLTDEGVIARLELVETTNCATTGHQLNATGAGVGHPASGHTISPDTDSSMTLLLRRPL